MQSAARRLNTNCCFTSSPGMPRHVFPTCTYSFPHCTSAQDSRVPTCRKDSNSHPMVQTYKRVRLCACLYLYSSSHTSTQLTADCLLSLNGLVPEASFVRPIGVAPICELQKFSERKHARETRPAIVDVGRITGLRKELDDPKQVPVMYNGEMGQARLDWAGLSLVRRGSD